MPLHPLVATFLHVGVISLFFNSIIRMECVSVCLLVSGGWEWVNKGRRQGPVRRKFTKAEEAKTPVKEWRPGFLPRRQDT